MFHVTKRDGKIAEFDISKISEALKKAFDACNRQYNDNIIDFLALKVTSDFEPKISEGNISVEDIQDSAEAVLSQAGYADVAKAYILYRKQREKLRNMNSTYLDYKEIVDQYGNATGTRVPVYGDLMSAMLCVSPNKGKAESVCAESIDDFKGVDAVAEGF